MGGGGCDVTAVIKDDYQPIERTRIRGGDLRDDDRCDFVGDNGLGLVVVDVDCLEGAHAERLPAVGHPVHLETLEWRGGGDWLRCGTGSCTHAPQAAAERRRRRSGMLAVTLRRKKKQEKQKRREKVSRSHT